MSDTLLDIVAATGVDHEIFPCDPELADTAQFCEAYGFRMDQSANTILVIGKSEPPGGVPDGGALASSSRSERARGFRRGRRPQPHGQARRVGCR